jgi:hypothetical protein
MPPYDGTEGRPKDFTPLTAEEIDSLVGLLSGWRLVEPAAAK